MGLFILMYVIMTVYLNLTVRYRFPTLTQQMSSLMMCPCFAEDPVWVC